uniref:hypothetical protein n=1 Tax=Yoonia sp. TaxID=2212373 RepID=UPI0040479BD0
MKRSAIIGALMLTTALVPTSVAAEPVSAFITGFIAAFGGSATTAAVASAIGGATAAGFATGAFLATGIGRTLLSLGLSAAIQAFNRPSGPPPSDRMVNFGQPISYVVWVFGRARIGGPLGFRGWATSDDVVTGTSGAKRHYSPVIAMHPCRGVVEHWLGKTPVEIDADGMVTTEPFAGYYRIRPFNGQDGQVADAELVASFPQFTTAFDFARLAGAHVWAKRPPADQFNTVYPNGREESYTPVIDAHVEVYDPRSDTSDWTQNAALIIAKVIADIWQKDVDWDEVAEQADICDVQVPKRGSGTVARWQINGTLSDDMDFETQRKMLMLAADVWFYERADGKVGFKVGDYQAPTITLTDADFLSIQVSTGASKLGKASEMALKYVEPANSWQESVTASLVIDENARYNRSEPEAYLIAEHNQAWRMLRRMAAIENPKLTLQGTLKPIGRYLRGERFVKISVQGLPEFVIEVAKLEARGRFAYDLQGISVEEADFEPDQSLTEPEKPVYQEIASDNTIPDLLGLSAIAENAGRVRYTWTVPSDDSLAQRIRLREVGSADWQQIDVPSGQNNYIVTGLGDATVEAQAVNITASQRRSTSWRPDPALVVESTVNATAPVALDAFSVAASGSDVLVSFTAPNDENYNATKIYRADYAAAYTGPFDIGDATLQRTEYGIPSNGDTWTDTAPVAGVHAYWARPINGSGKQGPVSGPETIETF